jgi:hypothetical protein
MMESPLFWPVFGLIVLVFIWASSRERIEKQKTLQKLLERNEDIDEVLLNRLLETRGFWKPGHAYRRLRMLGAFAMAASIPVGLLAFAAVALEDNTPLTGAAVAGTVFFLVPFAAGLGLFFSSRFCERPGESNESA